MLYYCYLIFIEHSTLRWLEGEKKGVCQVLVYINNKQSFAVVLSQSHYLYLSWLQRDQQ